ncbi:MAG TPA: GlsB/YeaQ/YmgE family stress response membrane protein [Lacipirellulaceae bacterium]|nr:GlsB/YeaQ/YmgE family stress response membrane protein [Lacipirellulaceae bacterium]
MHIIGWLIAGLVIGLIARLLMPGPQPIGLLFTIAIGVAGSFIGGAIANLAQGVPISEPRAAGWIGSVLGAVVLLFIYGKTRKGNP